MNDFLVTVNPDTVITAVELPSSVSKEKVTCSVSGGGCDSLALSRPQRKRNAHRAQPDSLSKSKKRTKLTKNNSDRKLSPVLEEDASDFMDLTKQMHMKVALDEWPKVVLWRIDDDTIPDDELPNETTVLVQNLNFKFKRTVNQYENLPNDAGAAQKPGGLKTGSQSKSKPLIKRRLLPLPTSAIVLHCVPEKPGYKHLENAASEPVPELFAVPIPINEKRPKEQVKQLVLHQQQPVNPATQVENPANQAEKLASQAENPATQVGDLANQVEAVASVLNFALLADVVADNAVASVVASLLQCVVETIESTSQAEPSLGVSEFGVFPGFSESRNSKCNKNNRKKKSNKQNKKKRFDENSNVANTTHSGPGSDVLEDGFSLHPDLDSESEAAVQRNEMDTRLDVLTTPNADDVITEQHRDYTASDVITETITACGATKDNESTEDVSRPMLFSLIDSLDNTHTDKNADSISGSTLLTTTEPPVSSCEEMITESTKEPTPEPSTLAATPNPEPSTQLTTPEPSTRAPTPEPSTRASTTEPSSRAPTPEPSTLAPTPPPSASLLKGVPSTLLLYRPVDGLPCSSSTLNPVAAPGIVEVVTPTSSHITKSFGLNAYKIPKKDSTRIQHDSNVVVATVSSGEKARDGKQKLLRATSTKLEIPVKPIVLTSPALSSKQRNNLSSKTTTVRVTNEHAVTNDVANNNSISEPKQLKVFQLEKPVANNGGASYLIEQQRQKIAELKKQNADLESERIQRMHAYSELDQENKNLHVTNNKLRKKLNDLMFSLENDTSSAAVSVLQNKQCKTSNFCDDKKLTELQRDNKKLNNEIVNLKFEAEALAEILRKRDEKIEDLTNQLQQASRQCRYYKEKCQNEANRRPFTHSSGDETTGVFAMNTKQMILSTRKNNTIQVQHLETSSTRAFSPVTPTQPMEQENVAADQFNRRHGSLTGFDDFQSCLSLIEERPSPLLFVADNSKRTPPAHASSSAALVLPDVNEISSRFFPETTFKTSAFPDVTSLTHSFSSSINSDKLTPQESYGHLYDDNAVIAANLTSRRNKQHEKVQKSILEAYKQLTDDMQLNTQQSQVLEETIESSEVDRLKKRCNELSALLWDCGLRYSESERLEKEFENEYLNLKKKQVVLEKETSDVRSELHFTKSNFNALLGEHNIVCNLQQRERAEALAAIAGLERAIVTQKADAERQLMFKEKETSELREKLTIYEQRAAFLGYKNLTAVNGI